MKSIFLLLYLLGLVLQPYQSNSQSLASEEIKKMIVEFKQDERGPYKDIRWFCPDGSFAMPREKCSEPGGVQRARYKDQVQMLSEKNHIFLGQILSTTEFESFWDEPAGHSRLKQYQLEKYLRSIDNGWILRKGQYYRGAFQVEDEENWGLNFYNWLLTENQPVKSHFYLLRQALKDIPHKGDNQLAQKVRAMSKTISDEYPDFMNLRVKIHGQPEAADIEKVTQFRSAHRNKMAAATRSKIDELIDDMEEMYAPLDLNKLNHYLQVFSKDNEVFSWLNDFIADHQDSQQSGARAMATAEGLALVRREIQQASEAKSKLALLELSLALETIFFHDSNLWQPKSLKENMEKICYSGMAAMGTGFIEIWEWERLEKDLSLGASDSISVKDLIFFLERSRSLIEWSTGMVRAVYSDIVSQFSKFEPMSQGFYDNMIRGSMLLPLGNAVGNLGTSISSISNLKNKVLDLNNQSTIRGLNPGYALGKLVVLDQADHELAVSPEIIYALPFAPSDIKPVAGIMTVSEGNMVSHVQLLSRNLGIPNAVLSTQNLEELKKYEGEQMFYAVSNRSTVIMKKAEDMTEEEKALFVVKQRKEELIEVPVSQIKLDQQRVFNMREINSTSSGVICGPKAANLGQLKALFPKLVVEGIVIPFGIFRAHMDLEMPGENQSYWAFLNTTFEQAAKMEKEGIPKSEIESFILKNLELLRNQIKNIHLMPDFITDLEKQFELAFSAEVGEVPVFLRSDTNMEDLKDFTGAGLNLTVFNVVAREKILQGIKDVWASPYSERSFGWRQRFLLNPENVYPSILIIPSVDVDYSGVMIGKGIPTGDIRDITISFSRGAGGAVDGQAAESFLLLHTGENLLLSPAREILYRTLPKSGGSEMKYTTLEIPLLNKANLKEIRWLVQEVNNKMAQVNRGDQGPYDVEMGFKDNQLYLFQIRPFVENKNAVASEYLDKISPEFKANQKIPLAY